MAQQTNANSPNCSKCQIECNCKMQICICFASNQGFNGPGIKCQCISMRNVKPITNEIGNEISILSISKFDQESRQILNSLIRGYMEIIGSAGSTTPGIVCQMKPQANVFEITQCFIQSSDYVAKLAIKFLKANPLYQRIALADRCSTFFKCSTRLKRIFLSAPATLNSENFNQLCKLYPEFHVSL